MKSSSLLILALMLSTLSPSQGALVINGDLSGSEFTDNNENNLTFGMLGTGWQAKSFWSINNGQLTHGASTNGDNWGVGQANAVTIGDAGGLLTFAFDWTPNASASAAALELNYQLVGWKVTGTPAATDVFFNGMNFNGNRVGNIGDTSAQIVDLLTGSTLSTTLTGTSTTQASRGSAVGTAGATSTVSLMFDLTDDASGLFDVSSYDYIGFRFAINSNDDDTSVGSTIDNVSLTAGAIPEPSRSVLLAAGLMTLILRRRR